MGGRTLGWTMLILALVGLLGGGLPALACAPTTTPQGAPTSTSSTRADLEARLAEVDAIFGGTIVAREEAWPSPAVVAVARYMAGSGPAKALVAGLRDDGCGVYPPIGASGTFYASGDPNDIMYLEWWQDAGYANRPEQATVVALVGHAAVAPARDHPLLARSTQPATSTPSAQPTSEPDGEMGTMGDMEGMEGQGGGAGAIWLPLLGAGGVLALVLGLTFRAARRRKSS